MLFSCGRSSHSLEHRNKLRFIRQQLARAANPAREAELISQNARLRLAARREYLTRHFCVPANARDRLLGDAATPSWADAVDVFSEVAQFRYQDEKLPLLSPPLDFANVREWTEEEVLEACGCAVKGTSAFHLFCEQQGVFDLWLGEYVDALAQHIKTASTTVLEVGAGNGRLSRLLRQRVDVDLIATDSGAWRRLPGMATAAKDVRMMSCDKALKHYNPHVVLCAWMPMQEDWTRLFRRTQSVREYILIGDKTCTGTASGGVGDGRDLEHVQRWQLCRHDRLSRRGHSTTTSYTRGGEAW